MTLKSSKTHHNKLDAPSGTALMIADAINTEAEGRYEYIYDRTQVRRKRGVQELGISAVRGGGIVGEHEVLFCGPDETLTLRHSAGSRGVFADGAIQAALYLAGQEPGYYTMDGPAAGQTAMRRVTKVLTGCVAALLATAGLSWFLVWSAAPGGTPQSTAAVVPSASPETAPTPGAHATDQHSPFFCHWRQPDPRRYLFAGPEPGVRRRV